MNKYLNKIRISPRTFSYLILAICLILTISIWLMAKNRLELQTKDKFTHKVDNITQLIEDRLNLYISSLYSVKGLFIASEEVTRDEFVKFTVSADIFSKFPGISSFIYAPKVNTKDIKTLEKLATLELTAKLATPTAYKINPQSDKDEYYPVLYVSPLTKEKIITYGYDYLSDPIRRTALEMARDQNQAIASAMVTALTTQKPAFLIFVPVYKNNALIDTVADRRKNISGMVIGTFRPDDLFSNILLTTVDETGINFEVYDGENQSNLTENRLLFNLDQGKFSHDKTYNPQFTDIKSIRVAERLWTIKYITTPKFETDYLTDKLPLIILLSGFDISLLIFLVLHFINLSNDRAVKLSRKIISEYKTHDKLHSHTRVEPFVKPTTPKV